MPQCLQVDSALTTAFAEAATKEHLQLDELDVDQRRELEREDNSNGTSRAASLRSPESKKTVSFAPNDPANPHNWSRVGASTLREAYNRTSDRMLGEEAVRVHHRCHLGLQQHGEQLYSCRRIGRVV